ncbi:phage terminase large subunit [Lysinibacillus sp. 1 U-2021]|uniref:phage terminase large subunit n=1 Tax=Lysinibacillus sp. 1 U-2021 TaxID=3039426 RepID=UPI002480CCBC|nr:phage terminase large subunit [Lysinibacillus sp. 1 U-2021]WGT37133.1 phage terminase large subunit [Lysinibacillus sp. 1 U-2021]
MKKEKEDDLRKKELERIKLDRIIKIKEAQESFYAFCKVMYPNFFTKGRELYTIKMCNTLQDIYEGKLLKKNGEPYKNISINLPPSFGKSFIAKLFTSWALAKDVKNQFMVASYNEDFASEFSNHVREFINKKSDDGLGIGFNDIFNNVKFKKGSNRSSDWALEGNYMNFVATSPNGSSTGKRGNVHIIDDLIKSAEVAFNEKELERLYNWYVNTFYSRKLQGGLTIMISTRWATNDVCGRLIEKKPDDWYVLTMPACLNEETQEMLCDENCNWETYVDLRETQSPLIFSANWLQIPLDSFGRLYGDFKTYSRIPRNENGMPVFEKIICYTDTADKGNDFLCSIIAGVYEKELYVLDVLYTKDGMSITEKKLADMLVDNKVNDVTIESNNGGEGYARSVTRILREEKNNNLINIETFHQSKNKASRILSMSSTVERLVYFPSNWNNRWNEFYLSIITFQSDMKKNRHDDSVDCLTGLVEMIDNTSKPITAIKSIFSY